MEDETPRPDAEEHKEDVRRRRRARAEGETEDETVGEAEEGDPGEDPAERRRRMHRPEEEVPREEDGEG